MKGGSQIDLLPEKTTLKKSGFIRVKFQTVTKDNIKNKIQKLNIKKLSTFRCTPFTILKDSVNVYLFHLTNSCKL